jgi:hypothetical protein
VLSRVSVDRIVFGEKEKKKYSCGIFREANRASDQFVCLEPGMYVYLVEARLDAALEVLQTGLTKTKNRNRERGHGQHTKRGGTKEHQTKGSEDWQTKLCDNRGLSCPEFVMRFAKIKSIFCRKDF